MGSHQLLVGGDHTFSGLYRPNGIVQGCTGAAHDLCHHVYLGVIFDKGEVPDELVLIGAAGEIPADQDVFQIDLGAHPPGDQLLVHSQHFGHSGAHRSKP